MNTTIIRLFFFIASILLFLSSLPCPAFYTQSGYWFGIFCLLFGWLGIHNFACAFSWLANPILVCVWMTYWIPPRTQQFISFYLSLAAIGVGLSFFAGDTIIRDEAGHTEKITSIGMGYILWMSSMAVIFLGNAVQRLFLPHPKEG